MRKEEKGSPTKQEKSWGHQIGSSSQKTMVE